MIDLAHIEKVADAALAGPEEFMALIETYRALITPRPISEYHEDMGDVLWWKFPIVEPPYVGSPDSLGYTVEAEFLLRKDRKQHKREVRMMVGGWPGYHTHFTPIPIPASKPEAAASRQGHPL